MVKKIFFALILINILFLLNVNASTVGGNQADSPTYAVISSNYNNVAVRIWTANIFGSDIVDYGTVVNDYVYVTACTDMPTLGYSYTPFYNNTTGTTASASDIRYAANLTSKTCTFNTGAQGKVAYFKFRLLSDLLNVPTSGDNTWLYNGYITFYIGTNRAFSFSIQNIIALDTDMDIYSNDFDTSILQSQNQTIINQQNQNTNSIINNQDSNTQDIIDNQNQNSQDIIDNQNSNTDKEIESQKVCKYIDKNNIEIDNRNLNASGTTGPSNGNGITNYINITNSTIELTTKTNSINAYACFYNVNKEIISCVATKNLSLGSMTIPNNAVYFRATIVKQENKPTFNICQNGNQALNDSVNDLNDTLNDTSQPNTSSDIDDMNDMVASDTPISDLITMPLTLINAYINGVNSSCSPYNLGNLYGTDLILPCINLEQRLGSNMWRIIDALFCLFMCYNIGMLFVTAFDGITSLRDDFEGLYQPSHAAAGYQPKHGGGN